MSVTLIRPAYYDAEKVNEWVCLSTDVKPTSSTAGFKLFNGDRVYELDTGKTYKYSAENNTWYEQPKQGGLGILNKDGEAINATLSTVQSVATQYMVTNYSRQPKTGDALVITLTDQSNDKVLYIYSETSAIWINVGINVDLTNYYTKAQVDTSLGTKENLGKITIGGTEYTVAISTTDAGQAGYITFVVEV